MNCMSASNSVQLNFRNFSQGVRNTCCTRQKHPFDLYNLKLDIHNSTVIKWAAKFAPCVFTFQVLARITS